MNGRDEQTFVRVRQTNERANERTCECLNQRDEQPEETNENANEQEDAMQRANRDANEQEDATRRMNGNENEQEDATRSMNGNENEQEDATRKTNRDANEQEDTTRRTNRNANEQEDGTRKTNDREMTNFNARGRSKIYAEGEICTEATLAGNRRGGAPFDTTTGLIIAGVAGVAAVGLLAFLLLSRRSNNCESGLCIFNEGTSAQRGGGWIRP